MPFNDVDVFRALTDQEVIHIQRTFDTSRDGPNDRVNFQTKESDKQEHPFPGHRAERDMNLPSLGSSCFEENLQ